MPLEEKSLGISPRAAARAIAALLLLACLVTVNFAVAKDLLRLSKGQVDQILKVVSKDGSAIPVPRPIADGLGLTPRQIAPSIRQATFIDPDGTKHGFAELNDGSGYFLFRRSQKDGLAVFHCDREFNLVGAIREFEANRFLALSDVDAKVEWDNEMMAWLRVVSQRGGKAPDLKQPLQPPTSAPPPAPATKSPTPAN